MKSNLLTNPIEVVNRLDATFGLTRENLLEVVEAMVAARNSCTENDPPSAPGWKAWCDGTRRLREIGTQRGWERNEEDHISSIYDPARQIKIAVCNTDDGTGTENGQPQNRCKKGAATNRAVTNNQELFNSILDNAVNVIQLSPDKGNVTYWYLCVYSEGDIVRAELSCPSECESGFFKTFRERINLIGDKDNGGGISVRRTGPDGDADFEINVTRKQA
ncbi:MAG: hypothetical protein ABSD58_15625 [Verrucomicrobiia bacterium]|jgi:hypothetical protein